MPAHIFQDHLSPKAQHHAEQFEESPAPNPQDVALDLAVEGAKNLREQDNLEWVQGWQRVMRRAFKGIVRPGIRAHYLREAGRRLEREAQENG